MCGLCFSQFGRLEEGLDLHLEQFAGQLIMAKKDKEKFHMAVITCNYEDILDKFWYNLKT